jgi:hypothetical protein
MKENNLMKIQKSKISIWASTKRPSEKGNSILKQYLDLSQINILNLEKDHLFL